jgi:primase-polymerase (primpol)-like protein
MSTDNQAAYGRNGTAVPDAMTRYPQFVVWRLVQKSGRPKPDKVPFNASTGGAASVDDPVTWCDCATAIAAYQRGGYDGIGFVFTASDPFAFIDLDDCRDGTATWKPHAQAIINRLPGAWEVSQSGKGLHGIGYVSDKARLTAKRRKWSDSGNRYECYTSGRFVAFGGIQWTGTIDTDWTDALASWLPDAEQANDAAVVDWVDQSRPEYDGPTDDDELITRLLASRPPLATFGRAPSPASLWNADAQLLGKFFPDGGAQERPFDHSSADLALANSLAWWTGCNPVRMERLFNRSALARDDTRKTRLAISKAIADPARSYFSRAQRQRDDARIGDDLRTKALPEIMTLDEALDDLIFVGDGSQVVSRASKRVRKFNDAVHEHAASKHFIDTGKIDDQGRPILKAASVMKLWLENPKRLGVDTLTWAPGDPEFCHAPERVQAGDRAYNLWTPPRVMTPPANWQAWVMPFLQHIAYLVPIEAERERFLRWIAHIFQRPGELPHTCYLMIATQTGIGRGTLASILTRALRGYVAANMNVDALFGGFNGRISQKLLATVDEVREGNSINRYAKAESLKSKITEETRSLNPKYGAQSVEKNCCRWLMFSNHLDALPIDNSDRRIIVIENPTYRAQPEWYGHLHGLVNDPRFIASIQQHFISHDITGFNPHEPAPINEAKRKALSALETDATRAIRDFARLWPDELATVSDLRGFMGDDAPTGRALSHEIERGGMQTGGKIKIMGRSETVLIIQGTLTRNDIESVAKAAIVKRIIAAQHQFRATEG